MSANKILSQIIAKGIIFGSEPEKLRNDKAKKKKFLGECYQLCNTSSYQELLGSELIDAIKIFYKAEEAKHKFIKGFNLDVIETIKELRKTKGPKQRTLAEILGMTQGNYSRLEKGFVSLTFVQFEIISNAMNIPVSAILELAIKRKNKRDNLIE